MAFRALKQYVEAQVDNGKWHTQSVFRFTGNVAQNQVWHDYTTDSGNPPTNFYASTPLVSAVVDSKYGIYSGGNVSPDSKVVSKITGFSLGNNTAPLSLILCDYLLYYPFIDLTDLSQQNLTNSVTLPRNADGANLSVFFVAQGSYVGGGSFSISYTNQDGISGRTSPTVTINSGNRSGSLMSSGTAGGPGPFIPLQSGDTGIRSVESITMSVADSGIGALVICKAICSTSIREIGTPTEKDFVKDGMSLPKVTDGAVLGLVGISQGNIAVANTINFIFEFVWG